MNIRQNEISELLFTTDAHYSDPFNEAELDVIFTAPDGLVRKIPAFWAGGRTWKARYSSGLIGTHSYLSQSPDKAMDGITGTVDVTPYSGENLLYAHGPIRREKENMYLAYDDGMPFFWLADTCWMGLTKRLPLPGGFEELVADRVSKGFNVMQIVAGLYPDMPPFDRRGANGAGFPWDAEYHCVNPAFFDEADKKIFYLTENSIVPCIVGSWGFHMGFAGIENLKRHWRYIIARWAAYPVVWCVAGEANLPYYTDPNISPEEFLKKSRADWSEVARYIRDTDPFARLVTIHPTENGHEQVDDESLLVKEYKL